jgi:glucose-6-phosphate isomerase
MLNWNIRSTHKSNINPNELESAVSAYQKTISSAEIGFFGLPNRRDLLETTQKVYNKFKHKKYFVHIGIGGSALGP